MDNDVLAEEIAEAIDCAVEDHHIKWGEWAPLSCTEMIPIILKVLEANDIVLINRDGGGV